MPSGTNISCVFKLITDMRRIVMFNNVSADGYFAGPDGDLNWVVPDPDIDKAAMSGSDNFDTVLFGRRTYELFASFWPHALDNASPSRDPQHIPRELTPEIRAMATFLNDSVKLVFSRTLGNLTWKNSRLMGELDPSEVEKLKRGPGGDMLIFGSGTIVTRLTEHKLIDEYQFIVRPILLGAGRPLLGGVSTNLALRLEEARGFPSGSVMLRYTPSK